MTTITPINQENKGRFNLRTISINGKLTGWNKHIFTGTTDTGKSVYVVVAALNNSWKDENSLLVYVTYSIADHKNNIYNNEYVIKPEELEQLKKY